MSVKGLIIALFIVLASFGVANAEARLTSDVDGARVVEYSSIFGEGVVMGYTDADRDAQVRMEGEHKGDMHMAKDDMHEGAKCHGDHHGNHHGCCSHSCGCQRGWYDCWNVWQTDDWDDFAAIRESDYDPVMGRGEYGRSFFGWGGW
jgi:hypothetical protein